MNYEEMTLEELKIMYAAINESLIESISGESSDDPSVLMEKSEKVKKVMIKKFLDEKVKDSNI